MGMQSFGKNVIVRRCQVPDTTEGGLHLPPSVSRAEYECRGIVLSVGDVEGIQEGDEIIFRTGAKFGFDGSDYVSVSVDDIIVVINNA